LGPARRTVNPDSDFGLKSAHRSEVIQAHKEKKNDSRFPACVRREERAPNGRDKFEHQAKKVEKDGVSSVTPRGGGKSAAGSSTSQIWEGEEGLQETSEGIGDQKGGN